MTEATTMRRPRPQAQEEPPQAPEAEAAAAPEEEEDTSVGTVALRGGWTAAQAEQDATSSYAQALKLNGDMQFIIFLEDRPYVSFRRHWMERTGERGTYKRPYTCLQSFGKECPLCELGDKPSAVSAFNVALIGDDADGQVLLKTFDVTGKLLGVLQGFATDPKIGPLTKGLYGVNKTSSGKQGTTSNNAIPIGRSAAKEDYGIVLPSDKQLAALTLYDASIVERTKLSDMQELADEMADED